MTRRIGNTTAYLCRFPGCEFSTTAPTARGKHESMQHGMSKGLLNGKAPNLNPIPKPANPDAPAQTAKDHLLRALDEVKMRQSKLADEIARLETVRQEYQKAAREQ